VSRYSPGTIERAREIAASYRLFDNCYVLGSLERGLTVHSQQLRAHNLIWALDFLAASGEANLDRVAIVGAGIGGLTTTACLMASRPGSAITLLEKRTELCPLQQGCDTRWLHPHIYNWPAPGSRSPGATVPVLAWSEGRASDVIHGILRTFAAYADAFGADERLEVVLGMNHFHLASDGYIEWLGALAERRGAFFRTARTIGDRRQFDAIILTAGFGVEDQPAGFPKLSYWRNDQLGQPLLDGSRRTWMVSGIGDGALIDLFRLTIERFRQDVILEEIFPDAVELEQVEELLNDAVGSGQANLFDVFEGLREAHPHLLEGAEGRLADRLRKDTRVILHAGGRDGRRSHVRELFEQGSSVFNRTLLYLLYRCGAFELAFDTLANAVSRLGMEAAEVICRHGTSQSAHVLDLFSDHDTLLTRVAELQDTVPQEPRRLWPRGFYPNLS